MDADAAPGAVWLTLVAAGIALLAWGDRRARAGDSPLGPPPAGELPDTRGPLGLAILLWLLAPTVVLLLLRPEPGSSQPGVLFTLKTLEACGALLLLRAVRGPRLLPTASRVRLLGLASAGGLVTFALTAVATWLVVQGYGLVGAEAPTQGVAEMVRAARGPSLAALVLASVVVGPVAEEVLFRGLLFPALAQAMPVRAALLVQALVFGFVHFWSDPSRWALALPLAVVGLCAGRLYQRTGSLWAAAGLHAAYNAIQVGFLLSGGG